MVLALVSNFVRSTVLTLETDSLVGQQVARERVAGRKDGKTNNNT